MMNLMCKKKGNITIILLGLVSVMLIMVMALSKRMTGHTQLLTLSDYTQISRYYLESYAGDILQQINLETNKADSELYKAFRSTPSNKKLSAGFYKPSQMLKKLGEELKIDLQLPPEIVFSRSEALGYPPGFDCPNDFKGKEKKGLLEILCKAKFHGRQYSLRVQYPFTVVMRMTPVIKDFMLFADKIAAEQGNEKIGHEDTINIMFTKEGKHPEKVDEQILTMADGIRLKSGCKYRPWVLLPPLDLNEYGDANLSGRVFLGPSNESVFLNLAGDIREEQADTESTGGKELSASVGEMFLVPPEALKVANDETKYGYIHVFSKRSNDPIRMIGLDIPLRYKGHMAKMGLLGFSYEIIPDSSIEGIFTGSAYTADDFFNSDNDSSEFWRKLNSSGLGYMSMSSGIKLMGPKADRADILQPNRQVFGNVLSRFFVLSFWWTPSGGGQELRYDETRDGKDFPTRRVYGREEPYVFVPREDNHNYQDYMSRIVSGKNWKPPVGTKIPPDGFMAYNSDPAQKTKRFFTNDDFLAQDGFKAKARLEELGQRWFAVEEAKNKTGSGIEARIGRTYSSGEEFLEAAGYNDGNFQVNGVVYIAGDLKMKPLKMSNDKIGGGVILVDGSITLDNITRGYNIDTKQFELGKYGNMFFSGTAYDFYQKWKTEITQDNFLTFVSLRGEPITIKGEALIGVHLICLNDRENRPYDQIIWSSGIQNEIVFCGGIACNYMMLPKRLEDFGRIESSCKLLKAPFFMYHSAMAGKKDDKEPSLAVQMMENMRGYLLTAGKVSGEDE